MDLTSALFALLLVLPRKAILTISPLTFCETGIGSNGHFVKCRHTQQNYADINVLALLYKQHINDTRKPIFSCARSSRNEPLLCPEHSGFKLDSSDSILIPNTHVNGYFSCLLNLTSDTALECGFNGKNTREYPWVHILQVQLENGFLSNSDVALSEHTKVKVFCSWKPGYRPMASTLAINEQILNTTDPESADLDSAVSNITYTIEDLQCRHTGNITCKAQHSQRNLTLRLNVLCDRPATLAPLLSSTLETNTRSSQRTSAVTDVSKDDGKPQSPPDHTLVLYIIVGCVLLFVIVVSLMFGITLHRKVFSGTSKRSRKSREKSSDKRRQTQLKTCDNKELGSNSISNTYEEIEDHDCSHSSDQWAAASLTSEDKTDSLTDTKVLESASGAQLYENETVLGMDVEHTTLNKSPACHLTTNVNSKLFYLSPVASESEKKRCLKHTDKELPEVADIYIKTVNAHPYNLPLCFQNVISPPLRNEVLPELVIEMTSASPSPMPSV